MWHCHFLEHEDHDMMRPILVMKDVHPVSEPHVEIEHATENHNATATTVLNNNDSTAPLLNSAHSIAPTTDHTQHTPLVTDRQHLSVTKETSSDVATHTQNVSQFIPQPIYPSNRKQLQPNMANRWRRRRP